MFLLNQTLKEKISLKLNDDFEFCAVSEMCLEDDCSCKGGCGTYTPPCSCCAYN